MKKKEDETRCRKKRREWDMTYKGNDDNGGRK